MDATTEIELLIWKIYSNTKLDMMEATRLALWLYKKEHPKFDDECLA
jgi:hypothetical protein